MEIELLEIRDFLAQHTPFGLLATEQLNILPKAMTIRYARRGTKFPPTEMGCAVVIVRSGALELRNDYGYLEEKISEGGIVTDLCQKSYGDAARHGQAVEDTLLYTLSCEKFAELRRHSTILDQHFGHSARERLTSAICNMRTGCTMTMQVRELLKRPPVTVTAQTQIQDAARLMTECNVSSLMVMENNKLVGIITDSDIRRRCVAMGLSFQATVSKIMSQVSETIAPDALLSTALMTMTRLHIHHLPVLEGPRLVGMLTTSDLTRQQSINSVFLAKDIRSAATLAELSDRCIQLPDLQAQLANSGASAAHIGQAISYITDSLTQRLLEMAEQELGQPPVPYVWLSSGSQARREQTVVSDQDNALIIDDALQPADEEYFAALSEFVCNGIRTCGFPYCSGGTMARTATWRQPLNTWRRYFRNWIGRPQPKSLMLASIFFDLRPVYGEISLFESLQQDILPESQKNCVFIAHMVRNALTRRPPLGFFRDFILVHDGKHDDTLDLKHYGIVPITDIARILTLSAGLPAVNTDERLHAARSVGALDKDMEQNLHDALELIASLRIRHQVQQISSGQIADNYLPPAQLSTLERSHLKDAFKIIRTMQNALDSSHPLGRMVP